MDENTRPTGGAGRLAAGKALPNEGNQQLSLAGKAVRTAKKAGCWKKEREPLSEGMMAEHAGVETLDSGKCQGKRLAPRQAVLGAVRGHDGGTRRRGGAVSGRGRGNGWRPARPC